MRRMDRRSFLRVTGLGAAAAACAAGPWATRDARSAPRAAEGTPKRPARDKPNLILFMVDDFGWETLGCYGSAVYSTPVLDGLAAAGARFNHCHAQPLCTPSRVQIMTGMYNCRNYVRFGVMDMRETTFAHVLKKRGYATGIAGKWQLGGDGETVKHFGFDEHCLWNIAGREGRFWNPRIMHDGKVVLHPPTEYGPDVVCKFALDFIERKKNGPFLLYYPMILTHGPYDPTPDSPDDSPKKRAEYKGDGGGDRKFFKDMVAYTDKIVGRVVDKLKELGIHENTLVLLTGDNGTAGVRGAMKDGTLAGGSKGSMTDDGTRVALVASWPGTIPTGLISDSPVDFTDLMPTLCEAAGAELPKPRDGKPIDGKSFLPILLGQAKTVREWIFCHYNPRPKLAPADAAARQQAAKDLEPQYRAHNLGRWARTQRYKLYHTGQFYDVSQDVEEKSDIPPGKGSPEAEAARKMLQSVHDSMPPWDPFQRTDAVLPAGEKADGAPAAEGAGAKAKAGKAGRKKAGEATE